MEDSNRSSSNGRPTGREFLITSDDSIWSQLTDLPDAIDFASLAGSPPKGLFPPLHTEPHPPAYDAPASSSSSSSSSFSSGTTRSSYPDPAVPEPSSSLFPPFSLPPYHPAFNSSSTTSTQLPYILPFPPAFQQQQQQQPQQPLPTFVPPQTQQPTYSFASASSASASASASVSSSSSRLHYTIGSNSTSATCSSTTSSQPSSPLSCPSITPEEAATKEMRLTLSHKPRHSGGQWFALAPKDRVRVTKGVGKKLRLTIECNFPFEWGEVGLDMVDVPSGQVLPPGESSFQVDCSKPRPSESSGVVEINLRKLSRLGEFRVVLTSRYGWRCEGRTVTFVSHNNGKQLKGRRGASSAADALRQATSPVFTEPNSIDEEESEIPGTPSPDASLSSPLPPPSPSVEEITTIPTEGASKKRKQEDGTATVETHQISGSLHVDGVVRAKGFIQYSDIRLKTNIADLMNAMEIVSKLEGKTYRWKKDPFNQKKGVQTNEEDLNGESEGGKRVIGLIAQEVQRVCPEVVSEDPLTGLLSVNYSELVVVVSTALKQHLQEYNSDKNEIRKELEELRKELEELKLASYASVAPSLVQEEDKEETVEEDEEKDNGDEDEDDGEDEQDDEDEDDDDDGDGDSPVRPVEMERRRPLGKLPRAERQRWRAQKKMVKLIKRKTDNFSKPMTPEAAEVIVQWAEHLENKAKLARQQARRRRKAHQHRAAKDEPHATFKAKPWPREKPNRKKDKAERVALRQEKEAMKFQKSLMMDPIKMQSLIAKLQAQVFRAGLKNNSKLVVFLLWNTGSVTDLKLHLFTARTLKTFEKRVEKKKGTWSIIGIQGGHGITGKAYDGVYRIAVEAVGGNAYHIQQAQACVAVFDFRRPGVAPLMVPSASVIGDLGKIWLVGSFLVQKNIFRWIKLPNRVVKQVPKQWETLSLREGEDDGEDDYLDTQTTDAASALDDHIIGGPPDDEDNPAFASSSSSSSTSSSTNQAAYSPPRRRIVPVLEPRRVFLRMRAGNYLSATEEGHLCCRCVTLEEENGPMFDQIWDLEFTRRALIEEEEGGCIKLREELGGRRTNYDPTHNATLRSYHGQYLSLTRPSPVSSSSAIRSTNNTEIAELGLVTRDLPGPNERWLFHLDEARQTIRLCASSVEQDLFMVTADNSSDRVIAINVTRRQRRGRTGSGQQGKGKEYDDDEEVEEEERYCWYMEVGPSREQQHAQQAQEVWEGVTQAHAIFGLSFSAPQLSTASPHSDDGDEEDESEEMEEQEEKRKTQKKKTSRSLAYSE